jgi:hypothetical protein
VVDVVGGIFDDGFIDGAGRMFVFMFILVVVVGGGDVGGVGLVVSGGRFVVSVVVVVDRSTAVVW